jgi:hypothetical protein
MRLDKHFNDTSAAAKIPINLKRGMIVKHILERGIFQ